MRDDDLSNSPSVNPSDPSNFQFSHVQIWNALVGQKRIIGWTVALSLLVAGGVTFYMTPIFTSSISLSIPSEDDIDGFNVFQIGVVQYDQNDIFELFKKRLESRAAQQQFLDKHFSRILGKNTEFTYHKTWGSGYQKSVNHWHFSKHISWAPVHPKGADVCLGRDQPPLTISVIKDPENLHYITLRIGWINAEAAAQLTNSYVDFVDRQLSAELIQNLNQARENSIANLESNIAYQRSVARLSREAKIKRLTDAMRIANSLNQTDMVASQNPSTILQITPPEQFFLNPKVIEEAPKLLRQKRFFPMYQIGPVDQSGGISSHLSSSPLYFRGSRMLGAEIKFLENLQSDDHYIPQIINMREQIKWLEQAKLGEHSVRTVRYFDPAYANPSPTRPDKLLIFSLAIALGFGLGVFGALSWHGLRSYSSRNRGAPR